MYTGHRIRPHQDTRDAQILIVNAKSPLLHPLLFGAVMFMRPPLIEMLSAMEDEAMSLHTCVRSYILYTHRCLCRGTVTFT